MSCKVSPIDVIFLQNSSNDVLCTLDLLLIKKKCMLDLLKTKGF